MDGGSQGPGHVAGLSGPWGGLQSLLPLIWRVTGGLRAGEQNGLTYVQKFTLWLCEAPAS